VGVQATCLGESWALGDHHTRADRSPLYSRKLHIRVLRASTSCETSLMILAFSLGERVVNHFASLYTVYQSICISPGQRVGRARPTTFPCRESRMRYLFVSSISLLLLDNATVCIPYRHAGCWRVVMPTLREGRSLSWDCLPFPGVPHIGCKLKAPTGDYFHLPPHCGRGAAATLCLLMTNGSPRISHALSIP
jgi:hypothetical protein